VPSTIPYVVYDILHFLHQLNSVKLGVFSEKVVPFFNNVYSNIVQAASLFSRIAFLTTTM